MEAEIAVMMPKAKEYLQLPETGRGKEESFSRGFTGNMTLPKT